MTQLDVFFGGRRHVHSSWPPPRRRAQVRGIAWVLAFKPSTLAAEYTQGKENSPGAEGPPPGSDVGPLNLKRGKW